MCDMQIIENPTSLLMNTNYTVNIITKGVELVDLHNYARENIPDYENVTEIPPENLEYLTSGLKASRIDGLFNGCVRLTTIPNLNIDTSQCTNMGYMFNTCSYLTSLDVSWIDTSNATDISYMFGGKMTSLDLSHFKTSKVTSMSGMFTGMRGLQSLDLSNFDTSNLKDTSYMFANCSGLKTLDISTWDTSKITEMNMMFYYCEVKTIDGIIDMTSCTKYDDMFENCLVDGLKVRNIPYDFKTVTKISSLQYTVVD